MNAKTLKINTIMKVVQKKHVNLLKIIKKGFVSEIMFVLIYYSPLHSCLHSSTHEYSHGCQNNKKNEGTTPFSLKRNVRFKNSNTAII